MSPLKLYLFGPPRLGRAGGAVKIPQRKDLALFAYLAVTRQAHHRDALAALFWPESDGKESRAGLRRALHRLREAAGASLIESEADRLRLSPSADLWLDVQAFRAILADCPPQDAGYGAGYGAGDLPTPGPLPAGCRARLAEAAALYTGDFMAGFSLRDCPAFDDWQFFESESLRQNLAHLLERLALLHQAEEAYEQAIEHARRWLALDPLHEPAHRLLITLYARAGQQAAALRQYAECARILRQELGSEPDAETQALHQAVLARQLTPRPPERTPAAPPSPAGMRSPGLYVREQALAGGAHGNVYRGRDQLTGQAVFIKCFKPELVRQDPSFLERFTREGEALRQLNHPNIVSILDVLEENGQPCIVMEYLPGGCLRDLLDRQPQLPIPQVLQLALELADALSRAHHLGILHRDLKPENVLLAEDGTPRLTDFGVARLPGKAGRLTEPGALLGSPAYLSPEAVSGQELDARADLWSFGVLLYEMIAGRLPFEARELAPLLLMILQEPVPPLERFRPEVPAALAGLVQRLLARDREARLSSMRQAAAALEAIRSSLAAGAAPGQAESPPALGASPPPAGAQADQAAQTDRAAQRSEALHLPTYLTPFIGREPELEALSRLLAERDLRLLTLLGPGGAGKTRLAVQAAVQAAAQAAFADGVYFVPLLGLNTAEEIVQAIGSAVQFTFLQRGIPPRRQILDFLHPRRLLLLLDNAEHLLDDRSLGQEVLALVLEILEAVPQGKLIITSRTRLNLQGEHLYPVGGMALPGEQAQAGGAAGRQTAVDRQVAAYSALQLFQHSARRVRPEYRITPQDLPAVVRLCQLVQGLPLGVELAAAWIELLSPEEIAAEIERSLDFLEGEWRDLPERQRSLRAVFEASWKALSAEERGVFQALTVFRGGFTRQAAQRVSGASDRLLLALANKSWLQREGRERFGLHELLRQFAAALFQADLAAWESALDRHAAYFAAFVTEQGEALKGPAQKQALEALAPDFQNIRAAWLRLVESRQIEIASGMLFGLATFCQKGTRLNELIFLLERALQASALEADRAESRAFAAACLALRYKLSYIHIQLHWGARELIRQAWELGGDLERLPQMSVWAVVLAAEYARQVGPEEGLQRLRRFLDAFRPELDDWTLAFTLSSLGRLLRSVDKEEARQRLSEARALFHRVGDTLETAATLRQLGNVARDQQAYAEAARFLEEGLAVTEIAGNALEKVQILLDLAEIYLHLGEFEKGFAAYDQQRQVGEATGWPWVEVFALSAYSYQSVRYGDLETAKEKRRQSQARALQAGDDNAIAWGVWETGELYRVEGDLETARRYFDEAVQLFEQAQVTVGPGFYRRGLGELALARGECTAALEYFQASLENARLERHEWLASYALSGLGRAAAGLGRFAEAGQYFREGLQTALDVGNPGLALVSLVGAAGLCLAGGQAERAAALAAFAQSYFATWRETKAQAAALLAAAGERLPETAYLAACAQGQRLSFTEAVGLSGAG